MREFKTYLLPAPCALSFLGREGLKEKRERRKNEQIGL
jgi:hypothetical protein